MKSTILGISIFPHTKKTILEKIIKYIGDSTDSCHIVSLNPENLVESQRNHLFKKALQTAQIKIIDGMGVVLAGRILNVEVGERQTGVDLMKRLIEEAGKRRLRVLLIGGKPGLALKLSQCYQKKFSEAKFFGLTGIKDIKNIQKEEERQVFSIVTDFKPHIIFVAFGSPVQEIWIEKNRPKFKGCVCMGVGGAFDYLSGEIKRAPVFIQKIGLEWLFRLINQPWRIKRQLKLISFLSLVIQERCQQVWKKKS